MFAYMYMKVTIFDTYYVNVYDMRKEVSISLGKQATRQPRKILNEGTKGFIQS